MNKMIEIRSYNLKSGTRREFLRLMAEEAMPMLQRWGVEVVRFGPSLHDEDSCYLIRAYDGLKERQESQDAFYGSDEWKMGPREAIVALIDNYTSVVIEMDERTLDGLRVRDPIMRNPLPLIEPGVLTIGVDAAAPLPMHSDPASPDFKGFEVDLINAVAARLGLSVKYRGALWSDLISDLLAEKIDLICSAATITAERKKIFDFSKPYLDLQLAIVVRNESLINAWQDLHNKIVGVRIATSQEDFLRSYVKAGAIHTFHMNTEAYATLQEGKLDAVIDDSPIAKSFVTLNPKLRLAGTIAGTQAQYGVMFKKGNQELCRAINNALTEIQADGAYAEFYKKWFGENVQVD